MRSLTPRRTRRPARKGFTLIELIVVIVILGILMAIGAFAYNNIIGGAEQRAVDAAATQVATSVQADSGLRQVGTNVANYDSATVETLVAEDLDPVFDVATAEVGGLLAVTVTNSENGKSSTLTFKNTRPGSGYGKGGSVAAPPASTPDPTVTSISSASAAAPPAPGYLAADVSAGQTVTVYGTGLDQVHSLGLYGWSPFAPVQTVPVSSASPDGTSLTFEMPAVANGTWFGLIYWLDAEYQEENEADIGFLNVS